MSRTGQRYANSANRASNPFDSDSDDDIRPPPRPTRRSSEPVLPAISSNPFDDDHDKAGPGKTGSGNPFSDGEGVSESQQQSKGGNSRYRIMGGGFVAQVKEKAASIGGSAMWTVGKSKEDGAAQAQTLKPKSTAEEQKQRDELFTSQAQVEDSTSNSRFSVPRAARDRYKNDFRDEGGFENQSVQELENYAVYKSEETTDAVNNCLKIAEDIREDGTRTMIMLHQQGEQIERTHMQAVGVDQELSRGEKLLGSLGGIFSKTWKPKKTRQITGPVITKGDSFKRRAAHTEQRERLGIARGPKDKSGTREHPSASTAQERIQLEKEKQDDALSDLSNLLGDLKVMAVDMGSEIERQNKALDHLHDDVEELNYRVKGANERGRRLLGK
ncbi:SNAP25 homologous protein SNAP33 [Nymphaea colorata]|nr:SNAP25 homologous protein SNAP33 [Nymphaea colorata]